MARGLRDMVNHSRQPMNKLPITVSMISGAEASRIGRALESVAGWTADIVVVLNEEVRDGTEEIAKRHGAKIIREKWQGFREQKNISLNQSNGPWVLCLDADEEVSLELRESIFQFFNGGDCERYSGAYFARKVWFLGRWITHGDWYPDHVLRLIKKGSGAWEGSPEHCKIEVKAQRKASGRFASLHQPHHCQLCAEDKLFFRHFFAAPAGGKELVRAVGGFSFRMAFLAQLFFSPRISGWLSRIFHRRLDGLCNAGPPQPAV